LEAAPLPDVVLVVPEPVLAAAPAPVLVVERVEASEARVVVVVRLLGELPLVEPGEVRFAASLARFSSRSRRALSAADSPRTVFVLEVLRRIACCEESGWGLGGRRGQRWALPARGPGLVAGTLGGENERACRRDEAGKQAGRQPRGAGATQAGVRTLAAAT
jgi:hypothetical protein